MFQHRKLIKRIIDMQDEWWKSDSKRTFVKSGIRLKELGMTDDEVFMFLCRLYGAVSSMYGD